MTFSSLFLFLASPYWFFLGTPSYHVGTLAKAEVSTKAASFFLLTFRSFWHFPRRITVPQASSANSINAAEFYLTCDSMSCHIKHMARGPSGRLVIEVDPDLKRNLHSALAADGTCLKDWFLGCVREYFTHRHQPSLPGLTHFPRQSSSEARLRAAEDSGDYKTRKSHK